MAEIQTCPVTREHPDVCCLMKLNDPADRCHEPAPFVVLLLEDGAITEHLRCEHHVRRELEYSSLLGVKPYRPRPGFSIDLHVSTLDDEIRREFP